MTTATGTTTERPAEPHSALLDPPLSHCPVCESTPLHRHGRTTTKNSHGSSSSSPRYRCPACRSVITAYPSRTRPGHDLGREFLHSTNRRVCLYLSPSHPYANSGGWQYRYRYRVMEALQRRLHPHEHVDHIDRDLTNDDLTNLRVLLIADHLGYHADLRAGRTPRYIAVIAEWVEAESRFVEYETPREC